jgi:hypothetical protein
VKDTVFCGTVSGGEPGDKVVLVNGRDSLDVISNCPSLTQRLRMTGPWDVFKLTLG